LPAPCGAVAGGVFAAKSSISVCSELTSRLEQLQSKKDEGLAFHEVFGRAP
jgi:hypothetical protein